MNSPESGRHFTRLEVLIRTVLRSQVRAQPAADARQRLLRQAAREQAGDPLACLHFYRRWPAPFAGALNRDVWSQVAYFSMMSPFSFSGGVQVQIR